MEKQLLTIEGTVESITFQSEDAGFTVLELDREGELVTVVGELLGVQPGERVKLHGAFVNHPSFGLQFKAQFCERTLPATAAAIEKYLASGSGEGRRPCPGPAAGGNVRGRHADRSGAGAGTPGGGSGRNAEKSFAIAEEYRRLFGIRSVMFFLSRFQIPSSTAIRIWKRWGPQSQTVIEENPHILCASDFGFTFEDCDDIARRMGVQPDPVRRLKAAVSYVLRGNLRNGHVCLPMDKLSRVVLELTGEGVNLLEEAVDEEVEDHSLAELTVKASASSISPGLFEAEEYAARRIRLMLALSPPEERDRGKAISRLQEASGIRYAQRQKEAIQAALNNRIFILTGGPGTGKTTTVNAILALLEEEGDKVALAAPTGRAAKRLSQVASREAKTIHRLLEGDFTDTSSLKFRRNAKNPLPFDTVIVDEASMVDILLFQSLLEAMRMGARLILVGDSDQLPSVGAGNVLGDLIQSGRIPSVELTEIFRQAAQSLIVTNAHAIVRGEPPRLDRTDGDFFFLRRSQPRQILSTAADLCSRRLPASYGYDPFWDIQVITPTRVGEVGSVQLNRLLQEVLNPASPGKTQATLEGRTFREGDKVMQIKNNYDLAWTRSDGEEGMGMYNGDVGVIQMIDKASKTILVGFEDRTAEYSFDLADQLELAYAITVHKSQGSEFEAVILPLSPYKSKMHYRNLLYTAVTRAKSILIVLGTAETLRRMVENNRKTLRYTNLKTLLVSDEEE